MGIFEQWLSDPGIFDRVNAEGARNVVAAAREAGARRVVHTSTFDVFHAETGGTVSEDAVADYPKGTAYERSKQRAEELVLAEAAAGIDVVIVNPSAVYGPGPWAGRRSRLRCSATRSAAACRAVPPGGMTLVHVDDVAAGHLAAFERGRPASATSSPTASPPCARSLRGGGRRGRARAGCRPPSRCRSPRGWRAPARRSRGLIRRPPLIGSGQLPFLLWQARADSSRARRSSGSSSGPGRRASAARCLDGRDRPAELAALSERRARNGEVLASPGLDAGSGQWLSHGRDRGHGLAAPDRRFGWIVSRRAASPPDAQRRAERLDDRSTRPRPSR